MSYKSDLKSSADLTERVFPFPEFGGCSWKGSVSPTHKWSSLKAFDVKILGLDMGDKNVMKNTET